MKGSGGINELNQPVTEKTREKKRKEKKERGFVVPSFARKSVESRVSVSLSPFIFLSLLSLE